MRKYDVKTYLKKRRRRVKLTHACIKKGFSWKTLILCDICLHQIPSMFMHPYSICVSDGVVMGNNCDIRQCVTIGSRHPKIPSKSAVIGNGVFFGTGCTVLGAVTIGDNAIIGAGAIVLSDVPANTTVVGIWKSRTA